MALGSENGLSASDVALLSGNNRGGNGGGQGGGSYRSGSYRGGYSRNDGRSEMMEHLEMALDSANEQDREDIRRFIREIGNA